MSCSTVARMTLDEATQEVMRLLAASQKVEVPWSTPLQLLLEIECRSFTEQDDTIRMTGKRGVYQDDSLGWSVTLTDCHAQQKAEITILARYPELRPKQRALVDRALAGDRRAHMQCVAYLRYIAATEVFGDEHATL